MSAAGSGVTLEVLLSSSNACSKHLPASNERNCGTFYKTWVCLTIVAPLCSPSLLLIAFSQSPETYRCVSKLWLLQQHFRELGLSQLLNCCETWHHSFTCDETLSSLSGFGPAWESVCLFYEKLRFFFWAGKICLIEIKVRNAITGTTS